MTTQGRGASIALAMSALEHIQPHRSWTDEYWLRNCEGFRVDAPDGRCVGYVEEVVRSDDETTPIALRVRSASGRCGPVVVDVDDVLELRQDGSSIVARTV